MFSLFSRIFQFSTFKQWNNSKMNDWNFIFLVCQKPFHELTLLLQFAAKFYNLQVWIQMFGGCITLPCPCSSSSLGGRMKRKTTKHSTTNPFITFLTPPSPHTRDAIHIRRGVINWTRNNLLESGCTELTQVTQVLCVELYLFMQNFFRLLEYMYALIY